MNNFFEKYSDNKEINLLSEICHEISNFKDKFKGELSNTYVLDPSGSSIFGFDIVDGVPYLGVPEELFEYFINIRWYLANTIKNKPGLFLVFDMGMEPNNRPVAIRIAMRTRRTRALSQFNFIRVIKINKRGDWVKTGKINHFDLSIREVETLAWEKFNK